MSFDAPDNLDQRFARLCLELTEHYGLGRPGSEPSTLRAVLMGVAGEALLAVLTFDAQDSRAPGGVPHDDGFEREQALKIALCHAWTDTEACRSGDSCADACPAWTAHLEEARDD